MSLRFLLTPLAVVALSISACAQSPAQTATPPGASGQRGPAGAQGGDRVEQQLTSLQQAVSLTADQTTKVRALLEADDASRPERGARGSGMREQMQARRAELNSKIEALLAPEQVEAFRTWASTQNQRGQRGGGRRGGNGGS